MSVLKEESADARRRTGWLIPVVASAVVANYWPSNADNPVQRSEQLWLGGLGLAGVAVGLLWQWFSPRALAPRLAFAAAAFVVLAILMLLPLGGDWTHDERQVYLGFGVISGLVLSHWWAWMHTADE
ncbi:hypothetical protein GCM10009554_02330 [Kribbella koreensis]|uniref:SPW repeat-containing protein n=1 Tax=Kribbella koreensis TaxID=57909 RepID=A0ABN1P7N5_9ACTN